MKYRYKKTGMTLKLDMKSIAVLAIILGGLALVILAVKFYPWPQNAVEYNGVILAFDVNLMDARNVPVYPNEDAVRDLFNYTGLQKLTFVFQNTSDSSLVKVMAVDIAIKFSYASQMFYTGFFNNTLEVKSFDNISTVAENPYVVLVPPSLSDGTYVKVVGNSVFISGKTRGDFYLATAKFVLSALGISL